MFELQSMLCELTGMDVANAGMYDGASALAEACLMACRITGRDRIAVHTSVNPSWLATVRTYAYGPGIPVDVVDGEPLTSEHACLAVQQPGFLGTLENVRALSDAAHAAGALLVAAADPISLGMLKPPGEYGADIAVAEGQSLGWPVNFGGPYLGLLTCRNEHIRQMPGRIVGRTTDLDGKTAYVHPPDARKHIRRERAHQQHLHQPAARGPGRHRVPALSANMASAASPRPATTRPTTRLAHRAHPGLRDRDRWAVFQGVPGAARCRRRRSTDGQSNTASSAAWTSLSGWRKGCWCA
jgi:hypothetical protein